MGRQPKIRLSEVQPPDAEVSPGARRRRRIERGRLFSGTALSLASHLLVLLALLAAWPRAPRPVEPEAVMVSLIDARLLTPPAPPAPPAPARAAPAKPASAAKIARPTPRPPVADALPAAKSAPAVSGQEVSGAQLAGAGTAETGGGAGQSCNMARRLQDALRKDSLVQASVAGLGGKAVMVWNGDWVWMRGDVGKGLAAVRQAMMWEIAFAPETCRTQAMHGLIVLTSNGADGSARLVVGSDQWRWSDLLTPHPGAAGAVLASQ